MLAYKFYLPSGDFTQCLTAKVRIVADVADDHKTPRAEINCWPTHTPVEPYLWSPNMNL